MHNDNDDDDDNDDVRDTEKAQHPKEASLSPFSWLEVILTRSAEEHEGVSSTK